MKTGKTSALSSRNVGKNKFLTCKDVLLEKYLLEKAAVMKNSVSKVNKPFKSDKKEEEPVTIKKPLARKWFLTKD